VDDELKRQVAAVVGCVSADGAKPAPGRYVGSLGRARVNLRAAAEALLP
jgi:hypothetical protein